MSRFFLMAAAVFAVSIPFGSAADNPAAERTDAAVLAADAYAILPRSKWDVDVLRELSRNIADMPDLLAGEALWAVAKAPASYDTTNIFANAISAPSPVVRGIAASLLVGMKSSDLRRLLVNFITTERNDDIVKLVVRGIASKPRTSAVRLFMDIMKVPGVQGLVVEEATRELRRLTHADISPNAGAWRDWWLDNEDKYND